MLQSILCIVVDLGPGDHYIFLRFSILEYLSTPSGQQAVGNSFCITYGNRSERYYKLYPEPMQKKMQ
ncbi:hypothetical protein BKA56DRAFT_606389 [Ilyonectria sp. MPI-CAGE-AT-0026]|nr:hypothetical protein BKA56DRAFT_606389 [Ilyonectria sp. MPI-CAGE-AT-0026]